MKRNQAMPKRTKPMQRGALKAARKGLTDEELTERAFVFARDGHCQLRGVAGVGECFGPLTPHHIKKKGQGGGYHRDNLVAMCAHHNDQIEASAEVAAVARALGFVKRSWED